MKKVLSKELFQELVIALEATSFASSFEINERQEKAPGLARINNAKDRISYNVGMNHYALTNENLNNTLEKITGKEPKYLISIHTVESITGSEVYTHFDTNSGLSMSLVLEDDFEGGELFVGGLNTNLNKNGDFVTFEGHKTEHHVTPVTSGRRKVLVLFYGYGKASKLI